MKHFLGGNVLYQAMIYSIASQPIPNLTKAWVQIIREDLMHIV